MSTSNPPLGPQCVRLDITAKDEASELFLVNGAYDLVGQAIGNLSVEVPPGQYHVRQRIGDTESVRQFDVLPTEGTHSLSLEPLEFPSPAPIIGSPSFKKVSPDDWKKPDALVGKPGIRLVIRDPGITADAPPGEAALAHLSAEKARLRLETMEGTVVGECKDHDGTAGLAASGLFLLDLEAAPGHYVLVQSLGGERQRCLPLIVHPDWSPRVYLLCGNDPDTKGSDAYDPVNFDKASIIYWPTASGSSPEQSDLIRLEAARKALARGRSMGGYLRRTEDGSGGSPVRDPMLALLDAYLTLKDMRTSEIRQAKAAIDAAAATLGEDFPDVIALRYAFATCPAVMRAAEAPVQGTTGTPVFLGGPPMLANSWRHLLAASQANARLSELMPPGFVPDTSRTWFIWNEKAGSRHATNAGRGTDLSLASTAPASGNDALDLAARGLVALMRTDAVQGWVDSLARLAAERKAASGVDRVDPLLGKLIDGLAAIQNPLLVRAFGEQELARRVLLSLNLPSDRLKDLLALLSATLDKNGLLRDFLTRNLAALGDYLLDGLARLTRPAAAPDDDRKPRN